MSYYEDDESGLFGLGSLPAGTSFPVGQQLVAGYNVQSSAPTEQKLQAVRSAMADGFRGSIVGAGWGGPGAPGGVPLGQVWIKVQTGMAGVTGAIMNSIFSNVAANAQSRLPAGSRVTNTYASTFGAAPSGGAPSGGGSGVDLTSLLSTIPGALPGAAPSAFPGSSIDPATGMPYGTMLPPAENFFTQSVGGIPVWGLLAGGTVAIGAIAWVVMGKPKAAPAAVKANRRRRSRRRGGFRRSR